MMIRDDIKEALLEPEERGGESYTVHIHSVTSDDLSLSRICPPSSAMEWQAPAEQDLFVAFTLLDEVHDMSEKGLMDHARRTSMLFWQALLCLILFRSD